MCASCAETTIVWRREREYGRQHVERAVAQRRRRSEPSDLTRNKTGDVLASGGHQPRACMRQGAGNRRGTADREGGRDLRDGQRAVIGQCQRTRLGQACWALERRRWIRYSGVLPRRLQTSVLTLLALVAFAANSVLTRLALGSREIDAASFTWVRLAAGALVLALIVRGQTGAWASLRGRAGRGPLAWSWVGLRERGVLGPLALFAYAAPFSFAYLRIGAAVGALVLFGVVQLTMIGFGILRGERLAGRAWLGIVLAGGRPALLTLPSASASQPDPFGIALMALAGIAWGSYSLIGRTAAEPLAANARSFLVSVPLALALGVGFQSSFMLSTRGLALALVSGGLTSGVGYAIWYRALRGLSVTQAAVVQLSVPIIAALGAVVFLAEPLGARLILSGAAVLGGVALVLSARVRSRA